MMTQNTEETDIFDLSPKTRPKSHSFKDIKDLVLMRSTTRHLGKSGGDFGPSKFPPYDAALNAVKDTLRPRTRSFIWDFRKFFSKNRTLTKTTSGKIMCAHGTSGEIQKDWSDSIVQLRKKSQSWSHYEAQKMYQKREKTVERRNGTKRIYSLIREPPLNSKGNLRSMEEIDNETTKCENTETFPKRLELDGFEATGTVVDLGNEIHRKPFKPQIVSEVDVVVDEHKNDAKDAIKRMQLMPFSNTNASVLARCALERLEVQGRHSCRLCLYQTYAVLWGQDRCSRIKIFFLYKHIQQIRRVSAGQRTVQILIKTAKQKVRFITTKHIFKDLYQYWRPFITAANFRKKVKTLRSATTASALKSVCSSRGVGLSRPISFAVPSNPFAYTSDGSDAQEQREHGIVRNSKHRRPKVVGDTCEKSTLDEANFTSLSGPMCTSSASLSSSSSSTATVAVGVPDSEFPAMNDSTTVGCSSNDNGNDDVVDPKAPCQCQSHLGRVLLDAVYPLTTEQIFEVLFSSTPWYHQLEETAKKTAHWKTLGAITDYESTSWIMEKPTVTTRTVTYTMALNNAIGPRSTSVTEKQICSDFHGVADGFSVVKKTDNVGIPYADSFSVQCTYCIIRAGSRHSRLLIHGAMIQKKNMWGIVKGLIEKSTYSGLENHYIVLEETLKLFCGTTKLSDEQKQATAAAAVPKPGKKHSMIADLVPSKLLHGRGTSSSSCLPECPAGIADCRTIQPTLANSADETNAVKLNCYGCENTERIGRLAKEVHTQTINCCSDKDAGGYSKLIVILISHISHSHCDSIAGNPALVNTFEQSKVPLNMQNFNQMPVAGEDDIFKADL